MTTTRLRLHINAPRDAVYRALIDAAAVARWMVPDGMTSRVHSFDPRVDGPFRISLTYDPGVEATGKSEARTDTYHGRFVDLVEDTRVVQVMEFETDDPALRGDMTATFELTEAADGGTELLAVHADVPPGVPPADNELGWRLSLGKLAALVEAG